MDSLIKVPQVSKITKSVFFAPTLSSQRAALRASHEQGVEPLVQRKSIAQSIELFSNDQLSVIGPAIGAPASVIACEIAIASGAQRIILIGTAGGLIGEDSQPNIADVIFPRGAISEEGTSILYNASAEIHSNNLRLQEQLEQLTLAETANTAAIHRGPVWSTDAPYRETYEKVQKFSSQGAIAVEMECAALMQLCNFREIEFAAVFVVSDLLSEVHQSAMKHSAVEDRLFQLWSIACRLLV